MMTIIASKAIIAILLASSLPAASADAKKKPATGKRDGDISAPVVYKDLMLVLTNGDGAAAVIFTEPIERGTKYRFRYETKDGKNVSGAGAVFEKYENGRYAGGDLFIEAGPIRLGWSNGDDKRGWIYYNPAEKLKVHIAHAKSFEDRVEVVVDQRVEFKKLDLKLFLK